MAYEIAALLILLSLSAFFSGSETSLFSLSKIRVKRLIVEKAKNSSLVGSLLNRPTDLLITILIGNMFANVFASSIAASLCVKKWGESGVGYSIIAMTCLVVVFCEIMPKIIAIKNAPRVSLLVAPLIGGFERLVFPVRWALSGVTKSILSLLARRVKKAEGDITKAELESAIKVGYSRTGILDKEEAEMMEDIVQLSDKKVADVMVSAKDIVSFPAAMPIEKMCFAIKEAELSRIPVYGRKRDDVLGILYAKDLLKKKIEEPVDAGIASILRQPYYVEKDMRLSSLLREFRSRKIHMALVKNAAGKITGLVTLEDLLEEIIGDIRDKEALVQRIRQRHEFFSAGEGGT